MLKAYGSSIVTWQAYFKEVWWEELNWSWAVPMKSIERSDASQSIDDKWIFVFSLATFRMWEKARFPRWRVNATLHWNAYEVENVFLDGLPNYARALPWHVVVGFSFV
jgi:hypothetical protein